MSVKIRLTRIGKKNQPAYRIVVTNSRTARDGKAIEIIGYFNPSHNPPSYELKSDRLEYWRSVGAQTTGAVKKLIAGKYDFKPYEPKAESKEEEQKEAQK